MLQSLVAELAPARQCAATSVCVRRRIQCCRKAQVFQTQASSKEQGHLQVRHSSLRQQAASTVQRALNSESPKLGFAVAMGVGVGLLLLDASLADAAQVPGMPDSLSQQSQSLMDLAENEGFWQNVLRYIQYFFTVLLGTAYVALKPFVELFKRPVTAILGIGMVVGLAVFVSWTVSAMLGMNDAITYEFSPYVD